MAQESCQTTARCFRQIIVWCFLILGMAISANAQTDSSVTAGGSPTAVASTPAQPDTNSEPYTLRKGDNEFGLWGGGSFSATTIFGGLHEDEARERKSFMLAFRYGRTIAANNSVALQYTFDAIPLELQSGNIAQVTTVGTVTTFRRETAYGGGLTPLGLQLDFANGSKIHLFIHVNGGGLIFNQPVPLPDSGKFAFVGDAGAGLRIFTSERRAATLGVRFHHLSNGDRSGSNRGLNQFVFYAGFSIFK